MAGKARIEIELFRQTAEFLPLRGKLPRECRAKSRFLRQPHYDGRHLRPRGSCCRLQKARRHSLIGVALGQAFASVAPRGGGFLWPPRKVPREADYEMVCTDVQEILSHG